MSKVDITYYFADVILPDEIEIFANEAGRQAIENFVDSPIEWDDSGALAVIRYASAASIGARARSSCAGRIPQRAG